MGSKSETLQFAVGVFRPLAFHAISQSVKGRKGERSRPTPSPLIAVSIAFCSTTSALPRTGAGTQFPPPDLE